MKTDNFFFAAGSKQRAKDPISWRSVGLLHCGLGVETLEESRKGTLELLSSPKRGLSPRPQLIDPSIEHFKKLGVCC